MDVGWIHHDLCHFSPEMLLYLSRNGTVKYSLLYECVDYRYLNKFTSGESAPDSWQSGSLSPEKKRNGGKINIFDGKVPPIRGNLVHFPGKKKRNGGKINIFSRKVHQKSGKMDQRSPAGPFFGADTKKTAMCSRFFAVKGGFEPPVPLPVRQFSKLLV